ncbi:MAG TPA: hypothetical protein VFF73_09420 [Planctomycetota bacterium]|nr:hypothetical protein [Planctomycetota bacterium]
MSRQRHDDDDRLDLEALASILPDMVMEVLDLLNPTADKEALTRFLAELKSAIAAEFDRDHQVLVALGLRKCGKREALSRGARLLRAATMRFAQDLRHVMGVRRKLMAREKKAAEASPRPDDVSAETEEGGPEAAA